MTVEEFRKHQTVEFLAFLRTLTQETDRGCALFAAAYLDKVLSDLLYVSLVEHRKVEEDLFEGTAPLSAFSSRIKFAFYLGKISAVCRADLDTIRKIRNDFAHSATLVSFDTQSVADRCRNLAFSYHQKDDRPRGHFTAAASGILAKLHALTLTSVAPAEIPDDRPSEAEKDKGRKQADEVLPQKLRDS